MFHFMSVLVVLLLTSCLSFGSDNPAAVELLTKSFQQANLWKADPVRLVAKVRAPVGGKPDVNLEYTISWAGPDKWRAEWAGEGYSQVILVRNGIRYVSTNLPVPPVAVLEFQAALGALDGYNLAGPLSPLVESPPHKIETKTKTIRGIQSECITAPNVREKVCIDPTSARAVRATSEGAVFDYSDYVTVGAASFPRTIQISMESTLVSYPRLLAEGVVTVTPSASLADDLFVPPANSRHTEFPNCADLDKTTALPRLARQVVPIYPEDTIRNHQKGRVGLYLEVTKDGDVSGAKVSDSDPAFDLSAVATVCQWKYTAYKRCGTAVGFQTMLAIDYSLQGKEAKLGY